MTDTEQTEEAIIEEKEPDTEEKPEVQVEEKQAEGEQEPEKKVEASGKKKEHWAHSRINELTAQKRLLESELAAARAQKVDKPVEEEKAQPVLDPEDLKKMVKEEAARQIKLDRFNARANEVYSAGTKEFDDFPDAVANLQAVGALGENGNPNFVGIVTELDDGHKVLHHLGNNPDEAARILALSPTKMAVELTKLETNLNSAQPVLSKTPKPVKVISGSAKTSIDLSSNEIPMDQWVKEREKQLKQRYARR